MWANQLEPLLSSPVARRSKRACRRLSIEDGSSMVPPGIRTRRIAAGQSPRVRHDHAAASLFPKDVGCTRARLAPGDRSAYARRTLGARSAVDPFATERSARVASYRDRHVRQGVPAVAAVDELYRDVARALTSLHSGTRWRGALVIRYVRGPAVARETFTLPRRSLCPTPQSPDADTTSDTISRCSTTPPSTSSTRGRSTTPIYVLGSRPHTWPMASPAPTSPSGRLTPPSVVGHGRLQRLEPRRPPLRLHGPSGIWEALDRRRGTRHALQVPRRRAHRRLQGRQDRPVRLSREVAPRTASIVWNMDYAWNDADWMEQRGTRRALNGPMSIYEVHLGSWMRVPEEGNRSLTYREMAPHAGRLRRPAWASRTWS